MFRTIFALMVAGAITSSAYAQHRQRAPQKSQDQAADISRHSRDQANTRRPAQATRRHSSTRRASAAAGRRSVKSFSAHKNGRSIKIERRFDRHGVNRSMTLRGHRGTFQIEHHRRAWQRPVIFKERHPRFRRGHDFNSACQPRYSRHSRY